MALRPGNYGIVKVIHGVHKGRIGYYDDDDFISSEDEMSDDEEYIDEENEDQVAIVYFGEFVLAPEHYSIPHNALEHVSMNDLMTRKEELFNLCSPFMLKKGLTTQSYVAIFLNFT